MKHEEIELLPCPFCGGKAEQAHNNLNGEFVECTECLFILEGFGRPAVAIESWNTRTANTTIADQAKEIERLTEWRIALESLTAQGSEFHNDLDACLEYIHRQRAYQRNAIKTQVHEIRRLEAVLKKICESDITSVVVLQNEACKALAKTDKENQ